MVKCARDRSQKPDDFLQLHRVAEALGEGPSLDELQDEVRDSIFLAVVKDVENIWVFEARNRSRLLLKPFPITLFFGEEIRQDLDGDIAIQGTVVRSIDGRHATTPNRRHNPVLAKGKPLDDSH